MTRRGQAALEYLFTYGWAFLAILLTVGSLAYFGVFNIDNFRGDSCEFPPGIDCQDYTLSDEIDPPNPALYVNLRNLHGADLDLTDAVVSSDITGDIPCRLADGSPITSEVWDFETVINISCPIQPEDYFSGQGYDFTLDIEFAQRDHAYLHESTGIIQLQAQ